MFLSGDPLRSPGRHGEQIHDKSFVIWLNAGAEDVKLTLPATSGCTTGEVVLSTNAGIDIGDPVMAGSEMLLQGRSVLVMRQS